MIGADTISQIRDARSDLACAICESVYYDGYCVCKKTGKGPCDAMFRAANKASKHVCTVIDPNCVWPKDA